MTTPTENPAAGANMRPWPYRRHPAEVTADRLADHIDRWPDAFDGATRDAIGLIRHVLEQIAEGSTEGSRTDG